MSSKYGTESVYRKTTYFIMLFNTENKTNPQINKKLRLKFMKITMSFGWVIY